MTDNQHKAMVNLLSSFSEPVWEVTTTDVKIYKGAGLAIDNEEVHIIIVLDSGRQHEYFWDWKDQVWRKEC